MHVFGCEKTRFISKRANAGQTCEDCRQLCQGSFDGHYRSRGIVSCRIQKTGRYDHKRCHAARQEGGDGLMLHIWDFVVVCDDGTEIFLHPDYTTTKVPGHVHAPEEDTEVPRSGPGGTSGPGTFKYFKTKKIEFTLRFDPNRSPRR